MTSPAEYVRIIQPGESIRALVEETKARAWGENVEFAALQLASGERIMVRGGPKGIEFSTNQEETQIFMVHQGKPIRVQRIFFHTHPRVTGPSEDDLKALAILRQSRSYIFEIGGDPQGTRIRPKGAKS